MFLGGNFRYFYRFGRQTQPLFAVKSAELYLGICQQLPGDLFFAAGLNGQLS